MSETKRFNCVMLINKCGSPSLHLTYVPATAVHKVFCQKLVFVCMPGCVWLAGGGAKRTNSWLDKKKVGGADSAFERYENTGNATQRYTSHTERKTATKGKSDTWRKYKAIRSEADTQRERERDKSALAVCECVFVISMNRFQPTANGDTFNYRFWQWNIFLGMCITFSERSSTMAHTKISAMHKRMLHARHPVRFLEFFVFFFSFSFSFSC